MKRRKAIQHIGVGLSAGLVLPSWLGACVDEERTPEIQYDGVVGVIGAGAAGLIAADILLSKGVRVKVFEANNRVGGRICSLYRTSAPTDSLIFFPGNYPYSDFPIELGPDRINGSDSKWANILAVRGVPVINFRSQSADRFVVNNNAKLEAEAMADSAFAAAKLFYDSFTSFSGSASLSVEQAALGAGVPASQLPMINSWLGNPFGSSSANIGARALAEGLALIEHNNTELTLRNNPMQDVLLSVYSRVVPSIRFNTVVQAINYGGETIEVVHNGGSDTVNKLIVTVPISVIKDGDISFSPSLPASKLTALSRLGMDPAMRIVLEFKRNFYGEDVAAIFGGTEAPIILNAGVGRSSLNKTLSITVFGSKANAYSAMDPDDVVLNILDEMDHWFNGEATENIRRSTIPEENNRLLYTIKDWKKDPYAKGGISYHLPGGLLADREALSAPVGGKLFFAGEATDFTGEAGTVSGALKSGERAAFELIDAILNG